MHVGVRVGVGLAAAGPVVYFWVDEHSQRPVLLFSGGVGLTPMLCMLHRPVRASNRRVYFLHACENGDVHAFADEVADLARERSGIAVHFCYREPTGPDRARGGFHSTGLVTRETLQAFLPLDDYEVYLCGPTGFMQANWRLLTSLGVAAQRIHYEFFGPATVLDTDAEPLPEPSSAVAQDDTAGESAQTPASSVVSFGDRKSTSLNSSH